MLDSINKINWINPNLNFKPFDDLKHIQYGFFGKDQMIDHVHLMQQVHGSNILYSTSSQLSSEADGLYTDISNNKIGIKTADCLPILIVHEHQPFVMAIHVGWKGLCRRIIQKAVLIIHQKNYNLKDIRVACGPCIGPTSYEVQDDFITSIINAFPEWDQKKLFFCLQKKHEQKWNFDLAAAAAFEFIENGLLPQKISIYRGCTIIQNNLWYSYRLGATASQRNISWINLC